MKCILYKNIIRHLAFTFACFLLLGCSTPRTQPSSGIEQEPILSTTEFLAEDGYRIPLTRYWPETSPDGIVIALHGFNDYSIAFEGMCQYFSSKNMACVAYDQRGFGGTDLVGIWPEEGRLQKDLYMIVKQFRKLYPEKPIFLVGESMGGAVIMTAMADSRFSLAEEVNGTLLYAPSVWARSTQPWYQQFSLWLAVHTFPGWMPTGEGLGVQASDNIDALRAMWRDDKVIKATRIDTIYGLTNLMDKALLAAKDVSIRTLVLYGDKDEVIPKKPTCEMLKTMRLVDERITFINYPDGYHLLTRDLQAERVFSDSVEWMTGGKSKKERFQSLVLEEDKPVSYCVDSDSDS
ncbi:MAG: alpha-beta hydrolase superfamily lysophospholipase [Oleiphilaceae bacterium]|jgi:alpha-beta hydrolase superfamily lysophospholipase